MLGAGVALLTSLAWSISSICIKQVADKTDSLSINTLRTLIGSCLLALFTALTGRLGMLPALPLSSLCYVVLSGILAMVLGDTVYIKSVSLLDVSIAFPLSQVSFILLAVLAAVLFLNEPFTWVTLTGAVLIVMGIYLMTSSKGMKGRGGSSRINPKGLFFILIAIVAWTGSTILLKIGVTGVDPFVAAGLRISTSALILTGFYFLCFGRKWSGRKKIGRVNLILIVAAGFLTYGVAAVGYITALQWIGAGRTVLLTATAPIFALPLAVIFLGERPTRRNLLGVLASVVGVGLVVY